MQTRSVKQKWLDEAPLPNEVDQNEDGSFYIPIRIVEENLSFLDAHWCSDNFKFRAWPIENVWYFSGSVELSLEFDGKERKMVGAFTGEVNQYLKEGNKDFEATVLSECIKNASKRLGNRMGRLLNPKPDKKIKATNGKVPLKVKPDLKIIEELAQARESGNFGTVNKLEEIYDFNIG